MKFKKLVASMVLCGMAIAACAMPASAAGGNTSDSAFEFKFDWANTTDNTGPRSKLDDSSTYINCTWIPNGGFQVYVDGGNFGANYVDCTVGQANIPWRGEFQIYNVVNENGYSVALLGGKKYMATTWASGVWSPDSVGNYPVANYYN